MRSLMQIAKFTKPYWRQSLISLIFLITVVYLDLLIPRLFQKIIDQGEIIEQGSHAELLAARGFYHHLYMSQFKGHAI